MFFKKRQEVVKKHVEEVKPEAYVIPQIEEEVVGLRVLKPSFEKTIAVSPMEGPYTKDVMTVPEVGIKQDVELAYDPFRVEKKLTVEDEIRRFGKAHHEFPSVDNEINSTNYTKQEEEVVEEESGIGLNFGIVCDAEELIKTKEEPVVMSNPYIHINTEEVTKREEIEINPVNISNEIKLEQEEYIAKPISRVPDFMQVKTPVVDESIPKTIVYGKAPTARTEEIKPVTIPPFVAEPTKKEEETEIVFEAPEVKPVENKPVYDTYKEPEQKKPDVIYEDKYRDYKYPPYSLLNPINETDTTEPEWVYEKIEIINNTLAEFGIDGEVVKHTYGPSVTRYEVKLSSGVNVKKVSSITDNMKMNLSARTLRIEAPIPGKSNVGIEVPNNKIRTVSFSEIVMVDEFRNSNTPLNIALGLNIDGQPVHTSIAKMPHGLIAGGTGSGKSVCVNGLLVSLLLKYSPKDLKMILVDPKQVELILYQDLPHLATPVITDPKMASEALKWACEEMDRRYRAFSSARARDIEGFNERIKNDPSIKKLPYLVIVIDELADLMLTCGNDVEASIQRITQMGRASGVHLIVATQRPTTDVVKGTIKANIPCRMAFKVSQYVDSATILDQGGAENLLGRGDMLFKKDELPIRIQGAFISDGEISRVCDYIRDYYQPDYTFTHEELQNNVKQQYGATSTKEGEDLELVYNVGLFVLERGTCSINSIQTSFNLGFRRAQRIVEILEEMGIVSGSKGTTGREILVTPEELEQRFKMGE